MCVWLLETISLLRKLSQFFAELSIRKTSETLKSQWKEKNSLTLPEDFFVKNVTKIYLLTASVSNVIELKLLKMQKLSKILFLNSK